MAGLRERKQQETRSTLRRIAMELFEERGYDAVSIAEIAVAANVSKMTVFNYFPTKEDLVVAPMEEHVDDFSSVVRDRQAGVPVVAALRAHFLERLAAFDPVSGLNDTPHIMASQRLVMRTPALLPRLLAFHFHTERGLAEALEKDADPLTARLAAGMIMSVRSVLVLGNLDRIRAVGSAAAALPGAQADANRAFDLLQQGLPKNL
jgi:AcrR family transcriptional regulator